MFGDFEDLEIGEIYYGDGEDDVDDDEENDDKEDDENVDGGKYKGVVYIKICNYLVKNFYFFFESIILFCNFLNILNLFEFVVV